ncbi:hypothetical protein [Salipaludibacillus sp. CF4.18]|uniref:hypothetical protein n=1 Tax=Salipaludibacillus sp. CF4.18 TaxID=3373081 RepID=UPI003EE49AFF
MNKKELYAQSGVAMTCRSFKEYEEMFELDVATLAKKAILDIAAGASSFTSELNQRGCNAIAADPMYRLSTEEINILGEEEMRIASQKLSKSENLFVWDYYQNLENHERIRKMSLKQFIASYKNDKSKTMYVPANLPRLPFEKDVFSSVFCNHFLFLYEAQFDYTFHLKAMKELIRVTQRNGSIYVYPLVGFNDEVYSHLKELIQEVEKTGASVEMIETAFRFLPSATHFLKITK